MVKFIFQQFELNINAIFEYILLHAPGVMGCSNIYSTMIQVSGVLIVLVGIFVVFRTHMQRERVTQAYTDLRNNLSLPGCTSRSALKEKALERWQEREQKNQESFLNIRQLLDGLIVQENILIFTINRGRAVVLNIGGIFLYYIVVLHLCSLHFIFTLPALVIGAGATVSVVVGLITYAINAIEPTPGEYLF